MPAPGLWKSFAFTYFVCILLCAPPVRAQSSSCGEPTSENAGWAPGSTVNVNINTNGMTQDQQDAIGDAIQSWQGTGGVTFNVTYSSSVSDTADYNIGVGPLTGAYGQTNSFTTPDSPTVVSATTTINQDETDYDAVFKTATHEIGHPFGLGEGTYGDSSGSTAMATGSCGGNPPNSPCGTEGPTLNDIDAVTCHDNYPPSSCITPGDANNPNCNCGSGTSGDC